MVPAQMLLLVALAVCSSLAVTRASVDLTTAHCHPQSSVLAMLRSACICEPCELCFFQFAAWECRALDDDAATDVLVPFADDLFGLDQPLLYADDWFLTEREITRSRGGIARDDFQVYSTRNHVELFAATDRFFDAVYRDVEALSGADDQLLLTGWSLANVPFRPTHIDWHRSTLHTLFGHAMERGAAVRALVWANVLERAQNVAMQHWMNSFDSSSNGSNVTRGLLLFDDRLPHETSSHHQKTLVLSRVDASSAVAFVGGVDLTTDRWDTRAHNSSRLRRLRRIAHEFDGWLDAAVRLEGRAAYDVAANFVARWNAPTPPLLLQSRDALLAFDNPVLSATDKRVSLPALTEPDDVVLDDTCTASVQIVRTFSCRSPPLYPFAPHGELSLLHARLKAIARAQNVIYIEDQYFVHVPALQTALLAALPRLRALVVVTQRPLLATAVVGYRKLLYDMLAPLTLQFPDKVHAFAVRPALALYVHTKVLLVDDVFVSIGSGNWNRRSMTSDSELAANIVDEHLVESPDGVRVGQLVQSFRLQKFAELTGRNVEALGAMTLMESVHTLAVAAGSASGLIERLNVEREAYFDLFPSELEDVIDPLDECPV